MHTENSASVATEADAQRQAEARRLLAEAAGAGVLPHGLPAALRADLRRADAALEVLGRRSVALGREQLRVRLRLEDAVELAASDLTLAFHAISASPGGRACGPARPQRLLRRRCFPAGAGSRLRSQPEALHRTLVQVLRVDEQLPVGALELPLRRRLEQLRPRLRSALDARERLARRTRELERELERVRAEHDTLRRTLTAVRGRDPGPGAIVPPEAKDVSQR